MKEKDSLRVETHTTVAPKPDKVADYVQKQYRTVADTPSGTKPRAGLDRGERILDKEQFEKALRAVSHPMRRE
jgi:hypothetical protein